MMNAKSAWVPWGDLYDHLLDKAREIAQKNRDRLVTLWEADPSEKDAREEDPGELAASAVAYSRENLDEP